MIYHLMLHFCKIFHEETRVMIRVQKYGGTPYKQFSINF